MSILNVVLVVLTSLSLHSAFAADAAVVGFQDAPKFYNQTKTVEGTIASTFCDDKRCFLNFDKDYHKYLSAVIEGAEVIQFTTASDVKTRQADLDKKFAGKKVQVTGSITEYKGKDPKQPGRPQIALSSAAQIKVLTK
jgi:TRAP-type mannitol/chloroaromatic compound transport system substrate-binding protein